MSRRRKPRSVAQSPARLCVEARLDAGSALQVAVTVPAAPPRLPTAGPLLHVRRAKPLAQQLACAPPQPPRTLLRLCGRPPVPPRPITTLSVPFKQQPERAQHGSRSSCLAHTYGPLRPRPRPQLRSPSPAQLPAPQSPILLALPESASVEPLAASLSALRKPPRLEAGALQPRACVSQQQCAPASCVDARSAAMGPSSVTASENSSQLPSRRPGLR